MNDLAFIWFNVLSLGIIIFIVKEKEVKDDWRIIKNAFNSLDRAIRS
ncbi:hypothetical protein K8R32_01200 [bacterium]|nr:hypothetical protein [bacterium]